MQIRRRYHLSYPGVLYVGVTMILAIGAINSQNNLLFIALGLSLGALIVSGVLSGSMLMGLRAERDHVQPGVVGGPMTLRYTVTNRSRIMPAFGLVISELPGERMRLLRRVRALLVGIGLRRLLRRRRSRATWPRRLPRPWAHIAHIGPRASGRATALVEPFRRGACEFEGVRITSAYPFGILRKSVEFIQPGAALVRPELAPVPESLFLRITSASDEGESETRYSGRGPDYLGLRDYTAGDSMRRIAWRASARTGQLVVLETAPPATARLWVGLDFDPGAGAAASGPEADANERAISLCAGVLDRAVREGFQVGLAVPALGLVRMPASSAARGESAARRLGMLLDDLARLDLGALRADSNQAPLPIGGRDACLVISAAPGLFSSWPRSAERHCVLDAIESDRPASARPSEPRDPLVQALGGGA